MLVILQAFPAYTLQDLREMHLSDLAAIYGYMDGKNRVEKEERAAASIRRK